MGDATTVFLFCLCTLCVIFLIYRKADSLKRVVSHQLKTFSEREGQIRLSEDGGPPARSFIEDDEEDENSDDDEDDDVLGSGRPMPRSTPPRR